MASDICIVGGGAALAQPLIKHWLDQGHQITAVIRRQTPYYTHQNLRVVPERELRPPLQPIDVLVTMTGRTENVFIVNTLLEQWDRVLEDTLTTPFRALRTWLPYLRDGGNVVIVGSIVGSTGGYGCASYAAAKAGLVGLVRAAANEVAERSVCVNLLELGYINAGMGARLPEKVRAKVLSTIPLGRFGTEADFVGAADYLAQVRYMSGGILTLAGGIR